MKITKTLRDNKELLRTILIWCCAIGMVWEIIHLQGYVKDISSPEFALQNTIPDDFKQSENNISKQLELMERNYINSEPNIVTVPYNPISKAIWSLVNLMFYLFLMVMIYYGKREDLCIN